MTIQAYLDELRDGTPGCRISAFGDLSSKLVLRSSARGPCTREVLDRMCNSAVSCFSVLDREGAEEVTDAAYYGQAAVMFTPAQSYVFARPDADADDVTLAVMDSAQDVEGAVEAVRDTMGKITEEGA